jgi:hypothetical protein
VFNVARLSEKAPKRDGSPAVKTYADSERHARPISQTSRAMSKAKILRIGWPFGPADEEIGNDKNDDYGGDRGREPIKTRLTPNPLSPGFQPLSSAAARSSANRNSTKLGTNEADNRRV